MDLLNSKAEVTLATENIENAENSLENIKKYLSRFQNYKKTYEDQTGLYQKSYEDFIENLKSGYSTASEESRKRDLDSIYQSFIRYQVNKHLAGARDGILLLTFSIFFKGNF